MHSISLICAALAAAIHYYIFYLEYPAYGSARFCRTFGVSPTELPTLRVPFRNLAIYNLMLAIGVSGGIVLSYAGVSPVLALSIMATPLATMPVAGAYLSCTAPDKRRAACIQAIPPLLASFGLFLS